MLKADPQAKIHNNIKKFREEKGITQTRLAHILTELAQKQGLTNNNGTPLTVRPVNVNKWETRNATPRDNVCVLLAEYFETDVDTILGRKDFGKSIYQSPIGINKTAYRKIEDINELENYNEAPVWVECDPDSKRGKWALVNTTTRCLVFADGSYAPFANYMEDSPLGCILLGPSPFAISMRPSGKKPIDPGTLKSGDKVYVKTIGALPSVSESVEGWYTYKKSKTTGGSFVADDKIPLPESAYGKDFVCFSTPFR